MAKQQKQYDKQFKIDAVEYYLKSGKPARVIAEHFGIRESTFYVWINDYKKSGKESFKGKGIVKDSNEELIALKREIADLRMERDILKKAVAIFSKPRI
jgi:transposase